ncbi:MAG: cell division protein FtsA [Parcubacteria group bacterium]|nr:cell division protein FtsA [Parcubacteria group bacterium]
MKDRLLVGLDLGSGTIRVAVGELGQDGETRIIGAVEGDSEGISKGMIISIEDAVGSITACFEKAERMVGKPLERAIVGISGSHIISQETRGVISISEADGEIKDRDVARVIEAARTVATPPNYDIIHIIPRYFTVDSQPYIKDPLGMTGVRLEVDAQVILGLSSQIKNLTKCVMRAGLAVDDIVFSPLACAEAVLTKKQRELGVLVVNFGNTTTSIAVFEEGDALTTKVLPIGSRHITSDLSIGFRIPLEVAEALKIKYGTCNAEETRSFDAVHLSEFSSTETGSAHMHEIAEIISARMEEILRMIDKELLSIQRSAKLPAGAVLTGAGAQLRGLTDLAKKILRLPVSIGKPLGVKSIADEANEAMFSTAIGLIIWGKNTAPRAMESNKEGIFKKTGKWFKNLIP